MTSEADSPPTILNIAISAAIQASPRFAGSMQVLHEGFVARRRARADDAVAEVLAQVDEDAVMRRMLESEEVEVLVVKMIQTAVDSTLASKRRLLGRVVARAVLDDAEVDRAQLVLALLAQFEAPQARCLEDVGRAEDEADRTGERAPTARGAGRELVRRVYEAGHRHDPLVLQSLESLGLLTAHITWDGSSTVEGLTAAGRDVLTELRAAGLEDEL